MLITSETRLETGLLIEDINYYIEAGNPKSWIARIMNYMASDYKIKDTVVVFDGDVIHRGKPLTNKNAHGRIARRLKKI